MSFTFTVVKREIKYEGWKSFNAWIIKVNAVGPDTLTINLQNNYYFNFINEQTETQKNSRRYTVSEVDIYFFFPDPTPFYWELQKPFGDITLFLLQLCVAGAIDNSARLATVNCLRDGRVTCVEPIRLFSWDIRINNVRNKLVHL